MGKWFGQANEIERLQRENKALEAEIKRLQWIINDLKYSTGEDASEPKKDLSVSAEEARIAATGKKIEAIKAYRARTGASLFDAKNAIDAIC